MPRQHPALCAARKVTATMPSTTERRLSSRSPLASVRYSGLPLLGLLLVCSGCYSPYRAPYGSPYGYPPGGVPTQTLQPGGTYTPSPYGQPATPYGTPQPTPGFPSIDQTGGSTPFYGSGSSGGGSTSQPYDGGGVPTYSDPNEVQFQQPKPDNTAIDTYGTIEGASAAMAGVAKVDLDNANFVVEETNSVIADAQGPVAAAQAQAAPAAFPDASGEFEAPGQPEIAQAEEAPAGGFAAPRIAAEFDVEAAPAPMPFPGEATPLPSAGFPIPAPPFAHDAEFTWLRGVLRFDPSSGAWMMIYSDNPSEEDEHGGKLLVADSPLLEQFKPQAVVLLRGGIDEEQSASAGRAVYRADVIEPVDLSSP